MNTGPLLPGARSRKTVERPKRSDTAPAYLPAVYSEGTVEARELRVGDQLQRDGHWETVVKVESPVYQGLVAIHFASGRWLALDPGRQVGVRRRSA
jgi:hypothetical protein